MKKMKILLALSMPISFLAGCANSTPSDWQYTKADTDKFNVVNSEILQTSNENEKILRITNAELLNEEIKDEDFIIFNYEKLIESEPAVDFYSYLNFKSSSVKVIKKEFNEDYTIDVYFEGGDEDLYGAIFNKSATYGNDFVVSLPELNSSNNANEKELDKFERELLESPNPEKKDGYIDLISHFDQLCRKIPNEGGENSVTIFLSLVALTLALYAFARNFYIDDSLPANFHYFNDLQNRLNNIDIKLNNISNMLVEILGAIQLLDDKTAVANCTKNIKDFKNDYVEPIGNHYRNFGDGLAFLLKDMAIKGAHVEVPYAKGDDGKYYRVPVLSKDTPTQISKGDIKFDNAKKYLDEHESRFDDEFVKKCGEDILASIKNTDDAFKIPEGLNNKNVATNIFETIVENYFKELFTNSEMLETSQAFRNAVLNYMDQLYAQDKAIVANYVTRCKLSYNFGAEAERSLRNNLAYLMFDLERNATFAQMVCRFSGVPEEKLTDKYIDARNCIKAAYQSVKNLPSNYCFRNNQKWETKLFAFADKVPDPQEDDTRKSFTHSLQTYDIVPHKLQDLGDYVEYNKDAHKWVDTVTLKGATARYNAITGKKISMLDYFRQIPGLVNPNSNKLIGKNVQEYGSVNILRFIGDFGTRAATDKDKNTLLTVVAKGGKRPYSPFFQFGDTVTYKTDHFGKCKDEHWVNGTFYTADVFDAKNGDMTVKKDLTMYCDYLETHWWWHGDEFWAFSGLLDYTEAHGGKTMMTSRKVFGLGIETTAL
ncbi:MAG: hypothetical protein MJ213_02510 [Bacilli bacterium]|nr:hypothetical protein [Bacilli bacterium]